MAGRGISAALHVSMSNSISFDLLGICCTTCCTTSSTTNPQQIQR